MRGWADAQSPPGHRGSRPSRSLSLTREVRQTRGLHLWGSTAYSDKAAAFTEHGGIDYHRRKDASTNGGRGLRRVRLTRLFTTPGPILELCLVGNLKSSGGMDATGYAEVSGAL